MSETQQRANSTRTPQEREERELRETLADNQWLRVWLLAGYYLLILTGLLLMYGRGDFSVPSFIYQGF